MFAENISFLAAFMGGLVAFFSPCILPLIPAYFTFITGFSLDELVQGNDAKMRKKVIVSTIAYVLGFSVVFILLGASASYFGGFINQYRNWFRIIGGLIVLIMGIHMTGLFRLPGLDFEKRFHFKQKPIHIFGSFFIGVAFAAGWSPCVGPILSSIMIMAGSQETVSQGTMLLTVFSCGLALPFLIISFAINSILNIMKKMMYVIKYINWIAGGLLIVMGILLLANKLNIIL